MVVLAAVCILAAVLLTGCDSGLQDSTEVTSLEINENDNETKDTCINGILVSLKSGVSADKLNTSLIDYQTRFYSLTNSRSVENNSYLSMDDLNIIYQTVCNDYSFPNLYLLSIGDESEISEALNDFPEMTKEELVGRV